MTRAKECVHLRCRSKPRPYILLETKGDLNSQDMRHPSLHLLLRTEAHISYFALTFNGSHINISIQALLV